MMQNSQFFGTTNILLSELALSSLAVLALLLPHCAFLPPLPSVFCTVTGPGCVCVVVCMILGRVKCVHGRLQQSDETRLQGIAMHGYFVAVESLIGELP